MELEYDVEDPAIPLHGDNKGAIDLALNPVTGKRSKHIAIKHHVIREYVEQGVIELVRTRTEDMVADGFTKSLPKDNLRLLNERMGIVVRQSGSRGDVETDRTQDRKDVSD